MHLKTWAKRAQDKEEWELLVVPGEWLQNTSKSEAAGDTPERGWWWYHLSLLLSSNGNSAWGITIADRFLGFSFIIAMGP
jgi:hypothetical protein